MVNHSLTNSLHHAARPLRSCAHALVRAVPDAGSASFALWSGDQRYSIPAAMVVATVVIAMAMPVSMPVTAAAVVAISTTINAALPVVIPDRKSVVVAFATIAAAPIAVATAPAPANRAAADGVIVRAGAANRTSLGILITGRIIARIHERRFLAVGTRRSGIAGRAAGRHGVAVVGRNAGASACGQVHGGSACGC